MDLSARSFDLIPMESNPNDLADTTLLSPIVLSLNKINHNGSRRDPNVVNESLGYKQWVPPEPIRNNIFRATRI